MTAVHTAPNPNAVRHLRWWAWLPRVLHVAAVAGVPLIVIAATGGVDAIAFWVEALFQLIVAFTLGAALFSLVGYLLAAPFAKLRHRMRPAISTGTGDLAMLALFVVGGTIYFLTEPSLKSYGVDLPTESTNLGALVVMLAAGAAGWALFRFAAHVHRVVGASRSADVLGDSAAFNRGKRPWGPSPDEPGQEFWSPTPVEGWRSWAWNGRTLHGYRVAWPDSLSIASCAECGSAPGWDHACGLYATKEREDVEAFGQVPVVGRVEMWGEVIEHEFGYRSSHARITDLWVDSAVHAARIRRAYPSVRVWEGLPKPALEVGRGEYR